MHHMDVNEQLPVETPTERPTEVGEPPLPAETTDGAPSVDAGEPQDSDHPLAREIDALAASDASDAAEPGAAIADSLGRMLEEVDR
jgi:hypothetical protein